MSHFWLPKRRSLPGGFGTAADVPNRSVAAIWNHFDLVGNKLFHRWTRQSRLENASGSEGIAGGGTVEVGGGQTAGSGPKDDSLLGARPHASDFEPGHWKLGLDARRSGCRHRALRGTSHEQAQACHEFDPLSTLESDKSARTSFRSDTET